MKKTILFIAVAATFVIGCSKSKDTTITPATATLTARGATYTQYKGKDTVANLYGHDLNLLYSEAANSDKSALIGAYLYNFTNTRLTAGTHNIGGTFNGSSAGQVQFLVQDSSAAGSGLYSPDSVTSLNVVITETGGKLTAVIPTIRLSGIFTPAGGTTRNDTITFSGTLIER